MSLILDALKKSEAERQLGRAPGLMSPTIRVSRRRGLSPWWGVLGLAVAIAAGGWWWVRTQSTASVATPTTDTPLAAPSTEPPRAPVASDAASTSPAPPIAPATSANESPPALAAPALPAPTESDAILPRDPEFDSVERESMPVAAQPAPSPPIATVPPSPAPASVDTAPNAATQPTATLPPVSPVATSSSSLPTIDATPAAASPSAPETAATTAPPPAEPPLEPLPRVEELMPDVRSALPALKLTMHAFGATPAARFVLIDGKRYAEGERIASALVVSEIRRDGAVLDFDGKRFLVPRP